MDDDTKKPTFTPNGHINQMLGEIHSMAMQALERLSVLPCSVHLQEITALRTKVERIEKDEERRAGVAAEPLGDHPYRTPSDLYKAVGVKVDQHVEQVEDSLTDRINLAALHAVKDAMQGEMEERAAEVKRRAEEQAAQIKLDLEKSQARAARFRVWGTTAIALLVAAGAGIGWKSCTSLERVQAKTEAALRRIEIKATAKTPDAAVEP